MRPEKGPTALPLQAKRLERGIGTLESESQWKERRYLRIA